MKHGYKDEGLWDAIHAVGCKVVPEPIGKANNEGRPIGHTTHNVFVKCKKTKQHFLVTTRQESKVDLKQIAAATGAKELRLASKDSCLELLGSSKGCLTCLALWYNDAEKTLDKESVSWVVEKELLDIGEWRICAGCEDPLDHKQHNIVDINQEDLAALLPHCWEKKWLISAASGSWALVSKGAGSSSTSESRSQPKQPPKQAKKSKAEPKADASAVATGNEEKPEKEVKKQQNFADPWLFSSKPPEETLFASAFARYDAAVQGA
ncbi:unnamed protein product [Amoebophrya sp. A25]|nr:unnamed protein product [Amoebophrya sp. A25]|eukprot:GSA25T00011009001.1